MMIFVIDRMNEKFNLSFMLMIFLSRFVLNSIVHSYLWISLEYLNLNFFNPLHRINNQNSLILLNDKPKLLAKCCYLFLIPSCLLIRISIKDSPYNLIWFNYILLSIWFNLHSYGSSYLNSGNVKNLKSFSWSSIIVGKTRQFNRNS